MKPFLIIGACVLAFQAQAQQADRIQAQVGQTWVFSSKDTVKNTTTRNGESSDMNTISETKVNYTVIDVQKDYLVLTQKISAMKLDFEGFGTKMSYDSDVPEKRTGMMAEQMNTMVNKTDTLKISITGESIDDENEKKGDRGGRGGRGGGGGMMRAMNQNNMSFDRAYCFIPAGVGEGQGWKKDGTKDNIRTQTIYFVEKINGDMVELSFKRKSKGTRTFNTQQGQGQVEVDNLSDGTLTVNRSTGRVTRYYEKANTSSKTNMMGMEMPSKGTAASFLTIE